ncbi:MAG: MtrB/PioB family decaheme-associated outer membrane protein [Gammaproteobacteria bacterium]
MKSILWGRHASSTIGLLAAFVVSVASADVPSAEKPATNGAAGVDPQDWKCALCPFLQGYAGEAELGAQYASGANASYGRYTGIDHSGTYADAGVSGQWRGSDGSYANYNLEDLGLASRDGVVDAGREGRYDLRASYDGQPSRLYDTAVTPYRANGENLGLPPDWVAAGSTAGMSTLAQSLAARDIGYDRRSMSLLGRYFPSASWTLFGEFRRQEKSGTDLTGASFLTQAVQLIQPVDYVTNSIETGVAWAGRRASFRLSYTGSWFEDNNSTLTFDNPYLPVVPGSSEGRIGVPPSNVLQQLSGSGQLQLPWFATTLSYSASLGRLRQNDAFLPSSTLIGAAVPVPSSLDGNVQLSHYAVRLASRPLPKLSIRGGATYDGRDDATTPLAVDYTVTDTFSGSTVTRSRYNQDRVYLDGGADYALLRWIKIGVGGIFVDKHYGPGQVLTNTQEAQSWGRASITPMAPLTFTLKYGNALRKVSSFNAAALPPAENPLIRAYDYAPRDRLFSAFTGAWTATSTLTWTAEVFLAKDDYRNSPLGLHSVHEQRESTTLTWTPRETLSAYVDAGYQRLFSLQNGNSGWVTAPWSATDTERFWNAGIGGRWVPQQRWTVSLDYLIAPSYGDTDTLAGGQPQAFPQNWTKLNTTRLALGYQWTAALQIHIRYTHESYNSNDWALAGVGPATVPNLLALGIQPYRDNVNLFGLTVRYQFGRDNTPARKSP